MTMTIDMHTHVAPRQAVKIAESGGTWHGVEFYRDKNVPTMAKKNGNAR